MERSGLLSQSESGKREDDDVENDDRLLVTLRSNCDVEALRVAERRPL